MPLTSYCWICRCSLSVMASRGSHWTGRAYTVLTQHNANQNWTAVMKKHHITVVILILSHLNCLSSPSSAHYLLSITQ